MGIEPATCGLQNRCSAVELRQQTQDTISVTKRIIQQAFRYVNAKRSSNMKIQPKQSDTKQKLLEKICSETAKTK